MHSSTDRSAAVAIVTGTLAGLATMALHPTGRDVVQNASVGASNVLVTAVHALALVGQGLLLSGLLALVQRLRSRADLAIGAYVFYALAAFAIIVAAAASGFLSPATVGDIADAGAADRALALHSLHYTGLINQAFAKISVLFTGIALLGWSIAILRGREMLHGIGVYGIIIAVVMLAGIMTGVLRLNIHGYGMVVLGQGLWMVLVARELWTQPGRE